VEFSVERHGAYQVIRVNGFLDVSTSPRLREQIHRVAEEAPRVVIVDLGAIEFLDSSALGVILNGWRLMQTEGGVLAVVSSQERITKLFEITALNLSIRLFSSLDEAVAELTA
jgi:anti-sigma B factor antagonist